MILVICAVAAELRGFARPGVDVVAVGVGPIEAAVGTIRALAGQPYTLVINAGIGGGFAGRAAVGEAIAVTDEQYVELGREDAEDLRLPGGLQLVTAAASDARVLQRVGREILATTLRPGPGITSATITTSDERAAVLNRRYAPATESMEGFAVLRAASLALMPAIELRGISNIVGARATSRWDFRAGAAAAVRALEAVIDVVERGA